MNFIKTINQAATTRMQTINKRHCSSSEDGEAEPGARDKRKGDRHRIPQLMGHEAVHGSGQV